MQVRALSIVDAIAQDIRNELFAGRITGGAEFTETSVAAKYDVARPTAKAAIEKLVSEGLLQRDNHKTARVPELGPEDVRDLYLSRTLLESQAVRYLAQRRLVPDAATTANAQIRAGSKGAGAIVEPTMRFHEAVIAALGSPRTSRLFETLMGEMRLCMAQLQQQGALRGTAIVNEHRRILECIEAGDPDAAEAALVEHFQRAQKRLFGTSESSRGAGSGRLRPDRVRLP